MVAKGVGKPQNHYLTSEDAAYWAVGAEYELADDLIWLSADQEEIGCLAMMALGIVWFESSSEQRAVMRQRPMLEATSRAIYRTVRRRRPKAVRFGSEADFIKVAATKLTAQLSDKMDARVKYADPEDCI